MSRFPGWTSAAVERLGHSKAGENYVRKYVKKLCKASPDYAGKIAAALKVLGIDCIREYRFTKDRRFRFDIALPEHKIAVEFEGNIFPKKCSKCNGEGCKACNYSGKSIGRHTRGKGYSNDAKKYNLAIMHGWKLLRYTTDITKELNWEFKVADEIKRLIESNKD